MAMKGSVRRSEAKEEMLVSMILCFPEATTTTNVKIKESQEIGEPG
jgi:hypothetical protein